MNRALRMLYRKIPDDMVCKPKCGDCCGPVPWHPDEWARVKSRVPVTAEIHDLGGGWVIANSPLMKCPFLGDANQCTVREHRPLLCRLFGNAEDKRMTCPHGCGAAHKLSVTAALDIKDQYEQVEPG